jgi:hypothetical protein
MTQALYAHMNNKRKRKKKSHSLALALRLKLVILPTWEVKIQRTAIQRQRSGDPIAINSWAWWYTSIIPDHL